MRVGVDLAEPVEFLVVDEEHEVEVALLGDLDSFFYQILGPSILCIRQIRGAGGALLLLKELVGLVCLKISKIKHLELIYAD